MPSNARQLNRGRACRTAAFAAAATVLALHAPAPAQGAACANASAAPGSVDNAALRRALRCVVNEERARHGLRRLRRNTDLGEAARGHARDMVERGYFAHERPGSTLRSRLRAAGWDGAAAAEALGWGCGGLGVPQAVLEGWLSSPPHREIVLGRYARAGVGVAVGAPYPTDCPGAGIWVLVIGTR
jgi:uncharacterized protein YkwD